MELSTYLHFNGDCEEAFKFYERCTGGKIETIFRHEGTPAARRKFHRSGRTRFCTLA